MMIDLNETLEIAHDQRQRIKDMERPTDPELMDEALLDIAAPLDEKPWDPHCPNMEPCDEDRQQEIDDENRDKNKP